MKWSSAHYAKTRIEKSDKITQWRKRPLNLILTEESLRLKFLLAEKEREIRR